MSAAYNLNTSYLHIAAKYAPVEIARMLLEQGCSTERHNGRVLTPLMTAILVHNRPHSKVDMMNYLIEHSQLDVQDSWGNTALMMGMLESTKTGGSQTQGAFNDICGHGLLMRLLAGSDIKVCNKNAKMFRFWCRKMKCRESSETRFGKD